MAVKHKIIIAAFLIFAGAAVSLAMRSEAQTRPINYGNGPVVDSDLDGLTDQGEKDIFKTDPVNPDTDGDGIYDGAEIISSTDPFDNTDPVATRTIISLTYPKDEPILWSWYLARSGGLIGFMLLYLSIFFGLAMFIPFLQRLIKPVFSYDIHRWISAQALFFVLIHGLVLLFDEYLAFSFKDIFVPMASSYKPELVTLGVLGMYIMLAIIGAAYLKRFVSPVLWKIVHGLDMSLYLLAFFHAYYLGTDMKNPLVRWIFLGLNAILVLLILYYALIRVARWYRSRQRLSKAV